MASPHSDSAFDDARIGERLRELRTEVGMSLRELAARLGISASALSQIENGKMQPSVSRLVSIMNALDVPLARVFASVAPTATPTTVARGVSVARAGEIEPLELSSGVVYRRLSPTPVAGVEFFESTYPPLSASSPAGEFLTHQGFEVGTMVSGVLRVEYEDRAIELSPGDAISHPATLPHRIVNPSASDEAVMNWLTLH